MEEAVQSQAMYKDEDGKESGDGMDSRKRGISGSTLKLIAVITMLIDHTAASVLQQLIVMNSANYVNGRLQMTPIVTAYWIMRGIGRVAFPIYIFLLLEGFTYTHNRLWYLGRLALFALISEIPFDMALMLERRELLEGRLVEFGSQNVFFTLAIGLLTIMLIDWVWKWKKNIWVRLLLGCIIAGLGMCLAAVLKTDYGETGVAAIVVAYVLRRWRVPQMVGLCVPLICSNWLEAVALINALPVAFYNGRRGWKLKWIFYAFYPAHLLILGFARLCMLL